MADAWGCLEVGDATVKAVPGAGKTSDGGHRLVKLAPCDSKKRSQLWSIENQTRFANQWEDGTMSCLGVVEGELNQKGAKVVARKCDESEHDRGQDWAFPEELVVTDAHAEYGQNSANAASGNAASNAAPQALVGT